MIQCVPSESGRWKTALKIEKFLDHLIMDVMDTKNKAISAIDRALEKGFYLLKPFWNTDIITRIEEYSIDELSVEEAMQLYSPQTTPEMIAAAIQQKFDVDMSQKVAKENRAAIEGAVKDILKGDESITLKVLDVICDYPDFALGLCSTRRRL